MPAHSLTHSGPVWPARVRLPSGAAGVLTELFGARDQAGLTGASAQRRALAEACRRLPALEAPFAQAAAALRRRGAVILERAPVEDGALVVAVSWAGVAVAEGNGSPGRLVWDVRPDPAALRDQVSRGREDFPLHTDSSHADRPHAVIAMAAVVPSDDGTGRSLLLPVERAAAVLRSLGDGEALSLLTDCCFPFASDSPDGHPVVLRRILDVRSSAVRVRYHERILDWGLAQAGGGPSPRHRAALAAFREALSRPGLATSFQLRERDVLLVDNHRTLHGRTRIAPAARRHLKRLKLHALKTRSR